MTTIIKFGGTLITEKNSRSRHVELRVLDSLCREISYIKNEKMIVVHGGGSFGHPLAMKHGIKYGASYRRPKIESEYLQAGSSKNVNRAFIEISESMRELNTNVVSYFRKYKIDAVSVHPHEFCITRKGKIEKMPLETLTKLVDLDFKPVLHGDIVLDLEWDLAILSGDQILMHLALERELHVDKILLLTDVNGVYDRDPNVYKDAHKYDVVTPKMYHKLEFERKQFDVTGGMKEKANLCLELAKQGIESHILNPFEKQGMIKEGILKNIIRGNIKQYGTIIRGD